MSSPELAKLMAVLKGMDQKITAQNKVMTEMSMKIKRLESFNAQILKKLDSGSTSASGSPPEMTLTLKKVSEIEDRSKAIEERSAESLSLLKSLSASGGGGGGKKRAWP